VERLRQESPLELAVAVSAASGAAIGAVWCVVQIVERIANFRLNRQKLKLELEKLRRETEYAKRPVHIVEEEEAIFRLSSREASPFLDHVGERLAGSQVRIKDLEVRITRRVRRKPDDDR